MTTAFQHSPADIVRRLLIGRGWGADPESLPLGSWPVYVDNEPDGPGIPDSVVTIYDTSPKGAGRAMPTGESVGHYGIQVRVRSYDFPSGWVKANELDTNFNESVRQNTVSIGSSHYIVWAMSAVNLTRIGRDAGKTKRAIITINALAAIRAAGE